MHFIQFSTLSLPHITSSVFGFTFMINVWNQSWQRIISKAIRLSGSRSMQEQIRSMYSVCKEQRDNRIIVVNFLLAVTTDCIILSSNKSSCIIFPQSLTFRKSFCVPGPVKDFLELMAWELPTHHPVQQNA